MPVVTFMPSGTTIDVEEGTYLLDAAEAAGIYVQQHCGNVAVCGWCRMTVLDGAEHLSAVERPEALLMQREEFAGRERASCQTQVFGDVTVTTEYW